MAITKDNKIVWADIQNIYTNLNTERSRFGFSTKTVPNNKDTKAVPSNVTDLKDAIQEMTSHYRLSTVASTTSVVPPVQGDPIKTAPFDEINKIITNIQNTPTYGSNFAYNSAYNGTNYGYDSTNYGFNNSNNVFDSSNNGFNNSNNGWKSGNFSYNASNNGWNSGNFSYNRSYNASNNGWKSGNFSYNKSNK